MKTLILGALLSLPGVAFAQQHDCRIKPVLGATLANLPGGEIRLTAIYRAVSDSASLTNVGCPDQLPPTWGAEIPPSYFLDNLGYKAVWSTSDLGPGIHAFLIASQQGYDPTVDLSGTVCVNIDASGIGHGVICPPEARLKIRAFTSRRSIRR